MEEQNLNQGAVPAPNPVPSESQDTLLNNRWLKYAVIVFILLIAGAGVFLLGKNSNQQTTTAIATPSIAPTATPVQTSTPSPTPTQQNTTVSPDKVAQDYYNWWLDCLNQKLSGAKVDCPYNKTGALTSDLASKLQQASFADPVLCAQNIPEKITFDKVVTSTNGATTIEVHTVWGSSPMGNISVGLQNINNQWKISSIDCNK